MVQPFICSRSQLRLLVILNNHVSFGILDLCAGLERHTPAIKVTEVYGSEFLTTNAEHFGKRGISLETLDAHAVVTVSGCQTVPVLRGTV
jgi:hypothetical protein